MTIHNENRDIPPSTFAWRRLHEFPRTVTAETCSRCGMLTLEATGRDQHHEPICDPCVMQAEFDHFEDQQATRTTYR